MIDRSIGVVGLALSIFFGIAPFTGFKIPIEAALVGAGIGLLLVGLAGGLFLGSHRKKPQDVMVNNASLKLHVYSDGRVPTRLGFSNVWRWYVLTNFIMKIDAVSNKLSQEPMSTILFISFDHPVHVGTLTVSSPDTKLPSHETKEFNSRFAIIVFMGLLPDGTVNVDVQG